MLYKQLQDCNRGHCIKIPRYYKKQTKGLTLFIMTDILPENFSQHHF